MPWCKDFSFYTHDDTEDAFTDIEFLKTPARSDSKSAADIHVLSGCSAQEIEVISVTITIFVSRSSREDAELDGSFYYHKCSLWNCNFISETD